MVNQFLRSTFQTIIKKEYDSTKLIKYQRICMFIMGYVVVTMAYSLKFAFETVIALTFLITGGLGGCSAQSLKKKIRFFKK